MYAIRSYYVVDECAIGADVFGLGGERLDPNLAADPLGADDHAEADPARDIRHRLCPASAQPSAAAASAAFAFSAARSCAFFFGADFFGCSLISGAAITPAWPRKRRITSYNVCYTKLLRAQAKPEVFGGF